MNKHKLLVCGDFSIVGMWAMPVLTQLTGTVAEKLHALGKACFTRCLYQQAGALVDC